MNSICRSVLMGASFRMHHCCLVTSAHGCQMGGAPLWNPPLPGRTRGTRLLIEASGRRRRRRCRTGGTTQLRKTRSIAPVLNAVLLTEDIEAQMGNTYRHEAVLPAIHDRVFRLNSQAVGE